MERAAAWLSVPFCPPARDFIMATASINMSLYRVLRSLDVPEEAAAGAAEAPAAMPVDLSHLATRDELRAELRTELARFATRDELRAEIAQVALRQTFWLIGAIFTSAGLIVALLRAFPAK